MSQIENFPLISAPEPEFPASPSVGERIDSVVRFFAPAVFNYSNLRSAVLAIRGIVPFHSASNLYRFRHDDDRAAEEAVARPWGATMHPPMPLGSKAKLES